MEKKSVKKNYIYNMIYQILVIIIPIITTPYLARTLGAEGNGIYGYTVSILTYFILFGNLGITMYGNREIAYVQNDKQKRSNLFWELFIFKTITMFFSIIVFFFMFARTGTNSLYYKILLIEFMGNLIDISWFYQGMEDFKKIVVRNFIIKLISVISIFMFIKKFDDLWKFFLITTLSTFIGSSTLWIGLKKNLVKPKSIKIKKHLKYLLLLFIPQIATQIYTVVDKTMIGSMLKDMKEVGYYEQAQKIAKLLLTIITSLGTVMIPRMASTYKEKDYEKMFYYMKTTINFVWLLGCAITFGLIAIAPEFVPLFFGKGYGPVVNLLYIFSFIVLAIGLNNVIGIQYLIPTKKEKYYTISVVSAAIFNFVLNLILINYIGTIGAAIASVLAETLIVFIQLYCIRKEFEISYVLKIGIKYVLFGMIMLIITQYVGTFFDSNIIKIGIKIFVGAVTYITLLLVSKDKFIKENIYPIINKIKRKIVKG